MRSTGQQASDLEHAYGVGATGQNIRSCAPLTTILVGRQDVQLGGSMRSPSSRIGYVPYARGSPAQGGSVMLSAGSCRRGRAGRHGLVSMMRS